MFASLSGVANAYARLVALSDESMFNAPGR